MKKIILILMLLPLSCFSSKAVTDKSLLIFENGCKNDTDPEKREMNCDLAKKTKKSK